MKVIPTVNCHVTRFGNESVVLSENTGTFYGFNYSATVLWDLICEGKNLKDLVSHGRLVCNETIRPWLASGSVTRYFVLLDLYFG